MVFARQHCVLVVTVLATTVFGVAGALLVTATIVHPQTLAAWHAWLVVVEAVPVVLGWLIVLRVPRSPVGPAVASIGACTSAVRALEAWGLTAATSSPMWGAEAAAHLSPGAWAWMYTGFLVLTMVFPDGLLPGRPWGVLVPAGPVSAAMMTVGLAGGGPDAVGLEGWQVALSGSGTVLLLVALVGALASLVVRYRVGHRQTCRQLRWLVLATGAVPVLLSVALFAWVADLPFGAIGFAILGSILLTMLVFVPAAVTVALLHHDLFDIDRLVGESATTLATTAASVGLFGIAVWAIGAGLAAPTAVSVPAAAFITALVLLPLHRRLHAVVGRVLDRERTVRLATMQAFADAVRDGDREPEEVEDVLAEVISDPHARLLLHTPTRHGLVDLRGREVELTDAERADAIVLHGHDVEVGVIVLSARSARRRRLASQAARAARLPIEVSRLRLELRWALEAVTASRSRLVAAATEERRQLERDLHDGVQQQLVAVGMRLRSLQGRLEDDPGAHDDLEQAVAELEDVLRELRRLAHGIRPARLDDGLEPALRAMAASSPVPFELAVSGIDGECLDDTLATTAYLVIAEAVANAWKHAHPGHVGVRLERIGGQLHISVQDDGLGGIDRESALVALRDRVASVGGTLAVDSPHGRGTVVTAVI